MRYLSESTSAEIREAYSETRNQLTDLVTRCLSLHERLRNEKAKTFCLYGLGRRTSNIQRCLERFQTVFERESAGEEIDDDTRFEQTAFLNLFLFALAGGMDNLAWVICHERNLGLRKWDIKLSGSRFANHISEGTKAVLTKYKPWLDDHLTVVRDSAAHRIAPFVVPYFQTNSGTRVFDSHYAHDFQDAGTTLLHPQVIVDGRTYYEIIDIGIRENF